MNRSAMQRGAEPSENGPLPSNEGIPDAEPSSRQAVEVVHQRPFFLRWTAKSAAPYAMAWAISASLGVAYGFLRHETNSTTGEKGWLLAFTIFAVTGLIYYASDVVEGMLRTMRLALPPEKRRAPRFLEHFQARFRDRYFLPSFFLWGLANVGMGHLFGMPEERLHAGYATLVLGYFLAGGLCGLAVWGIVVCVSTLHVFFEVDRPRVDVLAPDSAGGFHFVGRAFATYSWVTALAAAFIGEYVLSTPWTNPEAELWRYFWIGVPPFMAVLVLCTPALQVRKVVRSFKARKDAELRERMRQLRKVLETVGLGEAERSGLEADLSRLAAMRSEVHSMGDWPLTRKLLRSHALKLTGVMAVFTPTAYEWLTGNSGWAVLSELLHMG